MDPVLKLAAAASVLLMVASFMAIVAGPQLAKAFHRHVASLKAKPLNGIFVFCLVCICVAYGSVKPPLHPTPSVPEEPPASEEPPSSGEFRQEYVTGELMKPVLVSGLFDSQTASFKVKGLPSGLKFQV